MAWALSCAAAANSCSAFGTTSRYSSSTFGKDGGRHLLGYHSMSMAGLRSALAANSPPTSKRRMLNFLPPEAKIDEKCARVGSPLSDARQMVGVTISCKLKQSFASVLIASSLGNLSVEPTAWALESGSPNLHSPVESSNEGVLVERLKKIVNVLRLHPNANLNESIPELSLSSSLPVPTLPNGSTVDNAQIETVKDGANAGNLNCSTVVKSAQNNEEKSQFEPVTNESVVEEAWQVVNENFLDARRHNWSSDEWLRRKEDALKRPLRSRMAAYGAIRTMLGSLNDPYTRFLTPDQFLQLSKYDVTGIGLNIGEVDENGAKSLKVLGIVLGSPAQMMGVRQGDELVAVNGTAVRGMTAFEASSLIQGSKGTPVSIQIRHGPCQEVESVTVTREQDVRSPVFYRLERSHNSKNDFTGYIRLKEFNALAKRDLVTAMQKLQDAGATSFLLDLQDNPGGLVQAGIEIARLFLDGGETVIQTVGRDPSLYRSITANGVPFTKAPLMILVNDRTASASEIVAAALHDNCRAVLVGSRTFGKGLIQSVYELSDGSGIILTVGKYVTPGHIDIDGNGIEPDFRNTPGLSEATEKLNSCEVKMRNMSSVVNSLS